MRSHSTRLPRNRQPDEAGAGRSENTQCRLSCRVIALTTPQRKLHNGHFAFMRALAQGLDERASWDRYLRLEGEHTDLRNVRRTIAWIRDEFAAAAKREQRPGTARLILLDATRYAAPSLPTLAEFAAAQGLEEFSEAEQIEAYEDAYPAGARGEGGSGSGRPSRRARVIDRQLEALRWLQALVAQEPRADDGVAAWLNPNLARRLERSGIPTLRALCARINSLGARWWVHVPGVGERKASRILDWLSANQGVQELQLGAHVDLPRSQLTPAALAAVVPVATAIRPFEKFVLPDAMNGSSGPYRQGSADCLLKAANDHEAISAWLAAKAPAKATHALSATQRSYRREAERLLLWAVLEQGTALSALTAEDVHRYEAFLGRPPPTWCGPRHHQRWSPLWRPFEGPLSPAARRQSLVVLRSLFAFLIQQRYLREHPFAEIAVASPLQRPSGIERAFTVAQWHRIESLLDTQADTEVNRRLRRAMVWLYGTGMRMAELAQVKCGDIRPLEIADAEVGPQKGWQVSVVGRGGRRRAVPVPTPLVHEWTGELARHGFEGGPTATLNHAIPLLARFEAESAVLRPWSTSGIHQAIKAFLTRAATGLEDHEAEHLRKASAHWLRHSHGAHALQGREGRPPIAAHAVQRSLGHAAVQTTLSYLTAPAAMLAAPARQAGTTGASVEAVDGD